VPFLFSDKWCAYFFWTFQEPTIVTRLLGLRKTKKIREDIYLWICGLTYFQRIPQVDTSAKRRNERLLSPENYQVKLDSYPRGNGFPIVDPGEILQRKDIIKSKKNLHWYYYLLLHLPVLENTFGPFYLCNSSFFRRFSFSNKIYMRN